jgi:hypothetical protein
MWLVIDLELQPIREPLEAFRDMPPDTDQPRAVGDRLPVEFFVMVDVEDDLQPSAEGLPHNRFDTLSEGGINGIRCLAGSVCRPTDGDTDAIEACPADVREVILVDAGTPGALARRLEAVAHVDATTKVALALGHAGGTSHRSHTGNQ